jgi:hypothetical protein
LFNPSKGLNVSESTTPAGTPAAGRPFHGLRRRLADLIDDRICCDECGTSYEPGQGQCPTCVQRHRRRAGLESACECYGGDRPYLTVERSDPDDGTTDGLGEDGEPDGWPW